MKPTKLYSFNGKDGGLRRVGTSEGEIILFNLVTENKYHAQVITWNQIQYNPDPTIKTMLIRNGLVDKKGNILQ